MVNASRLALIASFFLSTAGASVINVSSDSAAILAGHNGAPVPFTDSDSLAAKDKAFHFTLRFGTGGFTDDRSPIGKLGGDQLALDIKPSNYPFAISITSEFYTNCPDPTHSYEIRSLVAVNFLYITQPNWSERMDIFLGGGVGRLEVPKGENEPDAMCNGAVYNLEAGFNYRLFWRIGFYGAGKYLYAQKTAQNIKVIDFSERIILLGFTFNFSL